MRFRSGPSIFSLFITLSLVLSSDASALVSQSKLNTAQKPSFFSTLPSHQSALVEDGSYAVHFDGSSMYTPIKVSFSPLPSVQMRWGTNAGNCAIPNQPEVKSSNWSDLSITQVQSQCDGPVCVCQGSVNPGSSATGILIQTTSTASWPELTNLTSSTRAPSALLPNKLLGGYFTDWSIYHYEQDFPYQRLYSNANRQVHLNTVFYQAAKIDNPASPSPTISYFDSGSDPYLMAGIAQWRYDHPQSRVLLSFGGWGDANEGTAPSGDIQKALDSADIATLAKNMVNAAIADGFNGVDIDFEWWGAVGTHDLTQLEAKKFVALFESIKSYEQNLQKYFGPDFGPLYLSIAAPGGRQNANTLEGLVKGGWQRIANAVDFFDPMTYDFYVAADNMPADHQSRYHSNSQGGFSIEQLMQYYHSVGVPSAKISLGIPAYAISEFGVPATGKPGDPAFTHTAAVPPQYAGLGNGVFSYKCLLADQNAWTLTDGCAASLEGGLHSLLPSTYHHASDSDNQTILAPWLIATDGANRALLSFDDAQSVGLKMQQVQQDGYATKGGYIWELDMDVSPLDSAYYASNSLLEALYQSMKAQSHA